jgi:creatinine amidohydrolase
MRPWKLEEMNQKQVLEHDFQVAVLPIGATEAHNLHLPYGTDTYETEAIADLACEKAAQAGAKVLRLPAIPYGVDANLAAFRYTIHVRQATLNQIVADIVATLERQGIRKLVILNGHGGNDFQGCLRDLYGQTKVFLALADWYKMAPDVEERVFVHPGEHGGEMETSCCLHLVPHLVRLEQADEGQVRPSRFEAISKKWVWTTRPFDRLTTNCGVGNPHLATAEKGAQLLDAVVSRLAQFLVELSQARMDECFPFVSTLQET